MDNKALLQWYNEAGVDEATQDAPRNWFTSSTSPIRGEDGRGAQVANAQQMSPHPNPPPTGEGKKTFPLHYAPAAAISAARELADKCSTLEELKQAVQNFDGCALKKTASNTVFSDGNPKAQVMIIGEAPGSEEDRHGIPFCGPSGKLLDKMFAAIGLNRAESLYISNTVFWRPPGNREPSQEETAICMPFVEKHIALIQPKLLVLAGGVAAKTLLATDQSVSRMRGRLLNYSNTYLEKVQVAIIYHPSYLLRSPGQKRLAWSDLLFIKDFLEK